MRHDEHAYDSIMNMARHVSADRPHMSNYDRAAQFAPFAALTGYDAAIEETARLTYSRPELDESEKYVVDLNLRYLRQNIGEHPAASVTYFAADARKQGGAIREHTGRVCAIDGYSRTLIFDDGVSVPIDDILGIG